MRSRPSLLTGAVLSAALVALGAVGTVSLTSTAARAAEPVGLHIEDARLVERDGTPFVARGINHAHTWYTSRTAAAIPDIKAAGANAIRVVLSGGDRWTRNDTADVADVIARCKAAEVICLLEDHDTTGYGEQSGAVTLDKAADYFVSLKSVLVGQEDYVQINIGNEPYGNTASVNAGWAADTSAAIVKLRAAGLQHNIVVDAPSWGQDWAGIMRDQAATVAAADPQHNVLFSVHMYGVYAQASTINAYFDAFAAQGLPLVVGEFGNTHSDGDVDEDTILAQAQARGIGWYGWSWSGNGGGVEYLDLATGWDPTNLSVWGTRLVDGPNGLRATSVPATVFGTTPTPTPTPTPTTTPTPTPTPTPTVGTGSCTATYATVGTWQGGFQGSVTVTAGATAIPRWSTALTLPTGTTVQGWSGTYSQSGTTLTVSNAAWNGLLEAGASTTYGFVGTGTPPAAGTTVTCA